MVRELIKQGNEFLNAFGSKDTIADGLSPRNIIDNLPHVDYNDLKYEFGQYVQLHVTEKVTNTMKWLSIRPYRPIEPINTYEVALTPCMPVGRLPSLHRPCRHSQFD